jgi:DNA-binding response OmpR family regulator
MRSDTCTVAIVDDDIRVCETLSQMIKSSAPEYRILCANNGRVGLSMICRQKPDVLILDIDMPGMSGLDVLQELKRRYQSLHLGVIILSGHHEEAKRSDPMYWYADAYLEKPCCRDELMINIRRLLSIRLAAASGTIDYSVQYQHC